MLHAYTIVKCYQLFKLKNGLVDVQCMVNNFLITRGHNRLFINISSAVDSYKFSFFPRVIPMWDALSSKAVNVQTLEQFQLCFINDKYHFNYFNLFKYFYLHIL